MFSRSRWLTLGWALGLAVSILIGIVWFSGGLTTIAPLPSPVLPSWITAVQPIGQTALANPILIRFQEPVIAAADLENPTPPSLLNYFQVTPALPGKFRVLTPHMIGFEPSQPLPLSTRVRVTLKAGLRDRAQHRLSRPLRWTFQTLPIALSSLPKGIVTSRQPQFTIQSNTPLTPFSLARNTAINHGDRRYGVKVIPLDSSPGRWLYQISAKQPLPAQTLFHLTIEPGLQPIGGNILSSQTFSGTFSTCGPLQFKQLTFVPSPHQRFLQGVPELQFSNSLQPDTVPSALHLSPAPPPSTPWFEVQGNRIILREQGLEPQTNYTITLDNTLQDIYGQTLPQSRDIQFRTGDRAPDFSLEPQPLKPGEKTAVLLTTINLSSYQFASTTVRPQDLVTFDPDRGTPPWLPPPPEWETFSLPQTPRNQLQSVPLPQGVSAGMVAYGVRANSKIHYGVIHHPSLDVVPPESGKTPILRVERVSDRTPGSGLPIDIYTSRTGQNAPTEPIPCATGITNNQGELSLNTLDLTPCTTETPDTDHPELLALTFEDENWAYARFPMPVMTAPAPALLFKARFPPTLRVGDRTQGQLSLINTTTQAITVKLTPQLAPSLGWITPPPNLVRQLTPGVHDFSFPIQALSPGKSFLGVTVTSPNGTERLRYPIEVQSLPMNEEVIRGGNQTSLTQIPIEIQQHIDLDAGGLEITVDPSFFSTFERAAEELNQSDALGFSEALASKLAIINSMESLATLQERSLPNLQLSAIAQQLLQDLQTLQRSDGGFSAYSSSPASNPFLSAYVARRLAKAAPQYPLARSMGDRLLVYLRQRLTDTSPWPGCTHSACEQSLRLELLIGLRALGEPRQDFLIDIFRARQSLEEGTRVKLLRFISALPDWTDQANTLSREISQNANTIPSTALPAPQDWLHSPIARQANRLRLLIDRQDSPDRIEAAVESLLSLQTQGRWGSGYDTAEALTALEQYWRFRGKPAPLKVEVTLSGKTFGSINLPPVHTFRLPHHKIPPGSRELTLKKTGDGLLHYLVTYRYRFIEPQPGKYQGLRINRWIKQGDTLQVLGIKPHPQPLSLKTGEVVEMGIEIMVDHPVHHLRMVDPLPAGLLPIGIASPPPLANPFPWDQKSFLPDRVTAYAETLPAGVYQFSYLARVLSPGNYHWAGASVSLNYIPTQRGSTAESTVQVTSVTP